MQNALIRHLFFIAGFFFYLFNSTLSASECHFCGHIYLGAGGGISYAHLAHRSTTIFTGTSTDIYTDLDKTPWSGIFQFNAGYEFPRIDCLPIFSLGIGFYDMSSTYGYTGQLAQSTGAIYNYQYTVTSARVMIEGQAKIPFNTFSPFVHIGVGPSWNNPSNYAETPANALASAAPLTPFQSRVNSNLAFQVGVGVDYGFNFPNDDKDIKHEMISVGYRYAYLGRVVFFTRNDSTYPFDLNKGVLTANEFYLSWRHLF